MRNTNYDSVQIGLAIAKGLLLEDNGDFKITLDLVNNVALLKITDWDSFNLLSDGKQRSLLKQYRRVAAINLLKYRDTLAGGRKRFKEGFVYLMQDTRNPEYIKVGKSIEPVRRLEEANCFSPLKSFKLIRWFFCEDAFRIESLVHRTFKNRNSSGEWFRVDSKLLEDLILSQTYAPLAKLDKARSF